MNSAGSHSPVACVIRRRAIYYNGPGELPVIDIRLEFRSRLSLCAAEDRFYHA